VRGRGAEVWNTLFYARKKEQRATCGNEIKIEGESDEKNKR